MSKIILRRLDQIVNNISKMQNKAVKSLYLTSLDFMPYKMRERERELVLKVLLIFHDIKFCPPENDVSLVRVEILNRRIQNFLNIPQSVLYKASL